MRPLLVEDLREQINALSDNHREWTAEERAKCIRGIQGLAALLEQPSTRLRDRLERLHAIIEHLDAISKELDGSDRECASCHLHVKTNWSESNAKAKLIESRKKFERMLSEEWARR